MSSYAGLYLQGIEIFVWRNEVDPTFLYLFTSQDVRRSSRDPDEISEYEPGETVLLTASASVLRDRLDVLGIGQDITESALKEYAEDKAETLKNIRSSVGTVVQSRIDLLETITPTRWADLLTQAIKSPEKHGRTAGRDPTSVVSLLEIWEDADPRFLLSAVLLACEDDDELTLDVSELISGGWLDDQFDPQSVAIEHFSSSLANGNPPVVITEGSTDAQCLQETLRIRFPHLRSFIKFFDFTGGAEGSAAAGVRTLKSFAAAGISNRVVLLLDNDTAARDALRALRGTALPSNYSVLHYPDIDLARMYPTLGPNGLYEMDVNGLAGSIEMYLGVDSLTGAYGKLSPVQWRSYIEGMKAYQGEVTDKVGINRRFREKVRAADRDPNLVAGQDWGGLDAIVQALIAVLHR